MNDFRYILNYYTIPNYIKRRDDGNTLHIGDSMLWDETLTNEDFDMWYDHLICDLYICLSNYYD